MIIGKIGQDYLLIRKNFIEIPNKYMFSVTISKLAEILFCTPRKAKNIIAKLVDLGWILFESGKGRGNSSQLAFLAEKEEILLMEAREQTLIGNIEMTFTLIKDFGSAKSHEKFIEWLSGYFGYEVKTKDSSFIETIRLPIYRTINTLDPAECYYRLDSHMVKQIYNTLVEYDNGTHQVGEGIAYHWHRNADSTKWILFLRKGIHFHNGKELTAEDVHFTFQRLRISFPFQNWLVNEIVEIEIQSKYVVCFHLDKPNYLFLRYLAYIPTSIVSKERIGIGTGRYKVIDYSPGKCVLKVHPHYFRGRGHIDRVEMIRIPEGHEARLGESFIQVRAGEGGQSHQNGWEDVEQLLSGCSLLTLNLKKNGPLQNVAFRKAFYHLLNRRQMLMDLGEPRFYPASSFNVNMVPTLVDKAFSLENGKEYLSTSDYNRHELTIYTYRRHEEDAYWLKNYFEPFGINICPQILNWKEMQDPDIQEQADMILFEAVVSEGEVQFFDLLQSGYSFIRNHLSPESEERINRMIEAVLLDPSAEERKKKLQEIERFLKENYFVIFLVHKNVVASAHPSLKGVKVNEKGWMDSKMCGLIIQNKKCSDIYLRHYPVWNRFLLL